MAIGNANGVRTEAFLTAMDAPLGRAVGNALEVIECIETLKGRGPKDLETLSVELAARMLRLGRIATNDNDARAKVRTALASGRALEKLRAVIAHQGGDPRVVDDYTRMPVAPRRTTFTADRSGFLRELDAELVGRATMVLGAGRNRVEDAVDPAVGAVVLVKPGKSVRPGEPLLELYHRDHAGVDTALDLVRRACVIGDDPPTAQDLIIETTD